MEKTTKDLYKAITTEKYHDANVLLDSIVERMTVERIKSVLNTQEEK